ncbi:SO_0444 family Cu/Zn efflux transporter [Desulforhopalus vacuolatus]|uniref:SO_0444 family Cu/Zn efflux transporter n=1 Tax=Desulforhopalus vacuolatus TaxID=40414 RepID=UPI001962E14E|nr:SO_0444 family Cu/Zn efflux transporter [Desulforhopalus vacuolatus]MBM9521018.1 SO_0444 family Cu/Zn efflux transporter [Desulforhopalus vacuolatus]
MLPFIQQFLSEIWHILQESSFYILMGILIAGLLKVSLNTNFVLRHLGQGRVKSVLKAALFGIPIPLCSCGVLPAAVSLRKQGANRGATSAFLIATPESGVDSITVSWALLDPIMTVVRPAAALITAITAGLLENMLFWEKDQKKDLKVDLSCPLDGCCSGVDCPPEEHKHHHTMVEKVKYGLKFSLTSVWGDIAMSFFVGVIIAAFISVIIPDSFMTSFLGGGFSSMMIMLVVGIPLYICATASTPVAAALILKGVSPGAALVFLLVGPATNLTSLSVLLKVLGKKSTALYLTVLSVCAVIFGLAVDYLYASLGISPQAVVGATTELLPQWLELLSMAILLVISVKPLWYGIRAKLPHKKQTGPTTFISGFPDISGRSANDHVSDSSSCGCGHRH